MYEKNETKEEFKVTEVSVEKAKPGVYRIHWSYTCSTSLGIIYQHKDGKKMLIIPTWNSVKTLKSQRHSIQVLDLIEEIPISSYWQCLTPSEFTESSVESPESNKKVDTFVEAFNKLVEVRDLIDDDTFEIAMNSSGAELVLSAQNGIEVSLKKGFEDECN